MPTESQEVGYPGTGVTDHQEPAIWVQAFCASIWEKDTGRTAVQGQPGRQIKTAMQLDSEEQQQA